ncbi:MAG TPA: hypothetical protein VFK05_39285, partial [Polyangiaceae bacterium]|nr:hypothetical protein [Polyangiaceae bacterium]
MACSKHTAFHATSPVAPAPIAIPAPALYSPPEAQQSEAVDVCTIDPAACPRLDAKREQRFSVAQASSSSAGGDILLNGPLAG